MRILLFIFCLFMGNQLMGQHSFFVNASYEPGYRSSQWRLNKDNFVHSNSLTFGVEKDNWYVYLGARLQMIRRADFCVIHPKPDNFFQVAPLQGDYIRAIEDCTHLFKSKTFALETPLAVGWKYLQRERFNTYIEFIFEPYFFLKSRVDLTAISEPDKDVVFIEKGRLKYGVWNNFSIRTGISRSFTDHISGQLGLFVKSDFPKWNNKHIGADIRVQYRIGE